MRYLTFIERELERCYYRVWCYSHGRGVNAYGSHCKDSAKRQKSWPKGYECLSDLIFSSRIVVCEMCNNGAYVSYPIVCTKLYTFRLKILNRKEITRSIRSVCTSLIVTRIILRGSRIF